MNQFQSGRNIDDIVRVLSPTGPKDQQRHAWACPLASGIDQMMPNLSQQRFPGVQQFCKPLFDLS